MLLLGLLIEEARDLTEVVVPADECTDLTTVERPLLGVKLVVLPLNADERTCNLALGGSISLLPGPGEVDVTHASDI